MKLSTVKILIHSAFWLLTIIMSVNYMAKDMNLEETIGFTVFIITEFAVLFYLNYFFLSKYLFEKKKYGIYILYLHIMLGFLFVIVNYTEYYWFFVDEDAASINVDLISNFVFILALSNLFRGLEKWFENEKKQAQLEKEKVEAELNFLKLQINPHFLFNSLNNIYSLSYTKDERAPEMISKLSKILRYLLYDCAQDRVLLTKEVEMIKNYIGLELLKIGDDRNVDVYTEGITLENKTAPMIFLTIIENCFKHGNISTNPNGWIKIEMLNENNILTFIASNSVSERKQLPAEVGGIGLINIKKRLKIYYSENYDLEIKNNESDFCVTLKIKLDK